MEERFKKLLEQVNPAIKVLSISEGLFEISDAREAIVLSQFLGTILPYQDEYVQLPSAGWLDPNLPYLIGQVWEFPLKMLKERKLMKSYEYKPYIPYGPMTRRQTYEMEAWEHSQILKAIRAVKNAGQDPEKSLIYPISEGYQYGDEPFWEYIAGCVLRKEGFIIARWQPKEVEGAPDLIGIAEPEVSQELLEHGFISNDGAFIEDISQARSFGLHAPSRSQQTETRTVVVEAESSPSSLRNVCYGHQLRTRAEKPGYLDCGCFDEGYATGPDAYLGLKYDYGVISNTEEGKLVFSKCPKIYSNTEQKDSAINQFKLLIKQSLIANLTWQEIIKSLEIDTATSFNRIKAKINDKLNQRTITEIAEVVASTLE